MKIAENVKFEYNLPKMMSSLLIEAVTALFIVIININHITSYYNYITDALTMRCIEPGFPGKRSRIRGASQGTSSMYTS